MVIGLGVVLLILGAWSMHRGSTSWTGAVAFFAAGVFLAGSLLGTLARTIATSGAAAVQSTITVVSNSTGGHR